MITWIILAYFAASVVAFVVMYAASVVAARADRFEQSTNTGLYAREYTTTQELAAHAAP